MAIFNKFVSLENGLYAGQRITSVPSTHLRLIAAFASGTSNDSRLAKDELRRRNLPDGRQMGFEISPHALDRASQRCLRLYKRLRRDDEGLYSWLLRECSEALATDRAETVVYHKMRFRFAFENNYIILKTVNPVRKSGSAD